MSVAQAARLSKTSRTPPYTTSPHHLLSAKSYSPKRRSIAPSDSMSSDSTASVNLARTHMSAVEAYHEGQEDIMDRYYASEKSLSPGSQTPSDVSEEVPMMPVRKVELHDFELIRVVGKGIAGRVLMVRHAHTRQIHAMKAISKRSVLANYELEHTLAELSILRRMGERAEGLSRFVSRLDYAFTDRDNFYFVMHFYPGGDLATQMERMERLGELRTRFYVTDLVQGLEELYLGHREGIIVRDLKPENILINERGHAVLADFGLSKEFAYRGDPVAMHVPRYKDQPVEPWWAGLGAGSRRLDSQGRERAVIDSAESFVGTAEYLAPEVIQRDKYSYAVDWWSMGCIMFECLVGRAPFKLNDEEDIMDLWQQILENHWTHSLAHMQKKMAEHGDFGIHGATYELLEALLQKNPWRRVTEPCIKDMPYFDGVDWDLVNTGCYVDPHGLRINPDPALNTRYFPKLCLNEDVSVDMTNFHPPEEEQYEEDEEDEGRGVVDGEERKPSTRRPLLTPLNDHVTYLSEQERFRKELASFYYVRNVNGEGDDSDQIDDLGYYNSEVEDELAEEEESSFGHDNTPWEDGNWSRQPQYQQPDEEVLVADQSLKVATLQHVQVDDPTLSIDEQSQAPYAVARQAALPVIIPRSPTTPNAHAQAQQAGASGDRKGSGAAGNAPMTPAPAGKATPADTPCLAPTQLDNVISPLSMATPLVPEALIPPSTPVILFSVPTTLPPDSLPESPTPLRRPPHHAPSSPVAISPKVKVLVHDDDALARPSISPRLGVRLPSGLPSSGLSTSDVVSVPSHDRVPNLIVRRNPHLAVSDHPPARLSVELHGTVTQLEEDEWEAVEIHNDIPSLPNGSTASPGSFLSRLRRKPSVILTSNLRRGQRSISTGQKANRSSDSGSSRVPSPTKGLVTPVRQLFGKRNLTLGKFRAFPGSKHKGSAASETSVQESTSMLNLVSPSLPASPTKAKGDMEMLGLGKLPERPPVGRRHTESGWFDKLRRGSGKATKKVTLSADVTPSARAASVQAQTEGMNGDGRSNASKAHSDGQQTMTKPARRSTDPAVVTDLPSPLEHTATVDNGPKRNIDNPGKQMLALEDGLPPLVWEYGDIEVGGDTSKLL